MNRRIGIAIAIAVPVLLSCGDETRDVTGPAPAAPTGSIWVRLSVTGGSGDPDGCLIAVDDGSRSTMSDGERHRFRNVAAGDHVVTISDVAPLCSVEGEAWRTVTVAGNDTSWVAFSVACRAAAVGNRIAFSSYRDRNSEIYLMDGDGSNPVRLTDHPGYDGVPDWSPDGTRIAFSASRDSIAGIYVMDADGSNVELVIESGWSPTWSPLGDRIAFELGPEHHIYTVGVDGSNPTPLLQSPTVDQYDPAWSPDGQMIAFRGYDGTSADIYVVPASGGVPINLTRDSYSDDEPAWSPDGKLIAFTSYKNWQPGVYVMDSDGSNVRQVVTGSCIASPTWSPDGARIAYRGLCSSGYEIVSVRVDGTDLVQLTDSFGINDDPDWSPIP